MINTVLIFTMLLITLFNMSCTQNRTYLTDQEKVWNPYNKGQILIFATPNGLTDTLEITKMEDNQFPDGLGALQNERLRVFAKLNNKSISKEPVEVIFLNIFSKTSTYSSKIDFGLSIADGVFWDKAFPINELEEYNENFLETSYGTFNDVIKIDGNSNRILEGNDIITIFWSKSVGYVKCETKDGTVWELINIFESQK